MHRILPILALASCAGDSSDLPIECPRGADAHQLVADDQSVELWCARPDGALHGPYRAIDANRDDTVRGHYLNDVPDGAWQWLDAGEVVRAGQYRGGVPCGTWDDNGSAIVLVECETIAPRVEAAAHDEGTLVDGKRHGEWQSYLGDDTLVARVTYDHGLRAGPATTFHANGEKACEGVYRDDLKDGAWTCWHDNGALASHQTWALGVIDGAWRTFDRRGLARSEGDYLDGVAQGAWSIWEDIGYFGTLALRAKRSGTIVDGLAEGPWSGVWDQAGQPKESTLTYVAGLREGTFEQWWPNGQLGVDGWFFGGEIHGRWKTYSDSGVLMVDEGFMLGVLDGDYAEFYDDGQPKARGRYHYGAQVGTWTFWDTSGATTTIECDAWGHCQ